ncbi:BspA family leucine-rich repeat surface protein [Allomuricauda sp. ARW1Y1]|jgi:surface protein|uniref:BspA family leucine-rich repeat surface protein n=1 Tax=Allomuricauda sp. ARW1Y1 TaxID=2663843 RepID=UPI0015C8294F|nr:BspA family leucine-rich repeat surface protein [Muricauda sp. ARW1Y1]NYJ27795.1 surface protein [Muricauda sp. ARW1Y1]
MKKALASILLGLIHFMVSAQTEFITTWKTDNPGVSANNQITIPTFTGEIYNYTVDWGDGNMDTNVAGDITHTYATAGIYEVSISGDFPRIYFNESGDADKLLNIKQWGSIAWTSMESAFAGCSNLSVGANDVPNLSSVTSLRKMFFYCNYSFNYTNREYPNFNGIENFNDWDVSTITDMSNMFDKSSFNQDVFSWDVSSVLDMSYMFFSSTFNQDISNWDVSNVQNMSGIFGSSSFRGDVTGWDVGNVTNMDYMFNSTFFDQDISYWDVSNVRSMRHMFSQCSFNQDISNWNVSNVVDMSNIFDDNDLSRENYDEILIGWSQLPSLQNGTILGAKDVQYCLGKEAREFLISNYNWVIMDQGENCEEERPFITTWKTDNPGFSEDNQITIPTNSREVYNYNVDWGDGTSDTGVTGDITHTYAVPGTYQVSITGRFPHIFFNNSNEDYPYQYPRNTSDTDKIISIDQWGTNRWISMAFAFAGCTNLDVLAKDSPDFSKDIRLNHMFYGCSSLKGNESMVAWDLSYVTFLANNMFHNASKFNQPIGDWDVSNIRYLNEMFQNATSFNQNLEKWNVGQAQRLDAMFDGSGISISNYDKILNAWSQLPSLQDNVKFGAKDTHFCNSESARQVLIDNYNWEITDAGKDCSSTFFITTWKTDNPGVSGDNQITIPTFPSEAYNYTVDWGDGTSDTNVMGDITHTYAAPGTYQVSIGGDFPRIYFNDFDGTETDSDKLISVDQWGSNEWTSMDNAFTHCSKMDVLATDVPDLSQVTSLGAMFRFCESLEGNDSFANWDVGNVTNFSNLFGWATRFNQDISNWDVSNAKLMVDMFTNATAFNSDISNWNLGNVGAIDRMFAGASSFNQPIGQWDVSGIKSMQALFSGASSFNQDISEWDMGNLEDLGAMFADAISFNQDISNWDVSKVTFMNAMFSGASSFNQPIGEWDVSKVTTMSSMFFGATSFNQPLNDWNTSNVAVMGTMFAKASSFNQPLSNWDVSNLESTSGMFAEAVSFNQDLSSWDMSNKTSIGGMFNGATSFDQNLGDWDIGNVINMDYLFLNAGLSLENYDKTLIGWTNLPIIQNNVVLNAGSSQYCESEEARQNLIDNFGWAITDGGKVPFCNEDNDADGILDHLDLCLDTRPNATVDEYGCEIIPADAVQVYVLTPSCIDSADGSVNLLVSVPGHSMDISIAGDSYSNQFDDVASGEGFEIGGLSPGSYSISLSVPEILFEQTYGVTVNSVTTVSAKRASTDGKTGTVVYEVNGSKSYELNINGEQQNYIFEDTGNNTIVLNNLFGQNEIVISGTSDCQGVVSDNFFIGDTIQVYPTITSSHVNVLTDANTLNAKVFGMNGRLAKEINYNQNNRNIDVSTLKSGVYLLQMEVDGRLETVKIIKR